MNAGRLQRIVMRSSRYWPLRWIYGASYGALLLWLVVRLRRLPEIRLLELRRPRGDHCFGSSDLDLRAQTLRLTATEYFGLCDRLADVLRPRKRWMKILDFHLVGPAEMELQRRLGAISFGDSRWIRLFGHQSAPATPAELTAAPCRAMYEYGYICQELFERRFDLHSTRSLYRRMTRVDHEFRSLRGSLDEPGADLRRQVMSVAESVTAKGRLRIARPDELESVFALAICELDSIARCSAATRGLDSDFLPVAESLAPANLSRAVASCSVAINELCRENSKLLLSAIIGGVPGTGFDYRIYLIVRGGLGVNELLEVHRAIRSTYTAANSSSRIPTTYLRLRHPTVLTPQMWRASSRWYHALRPVEEYYLLRRHGVVLWGEDLRGELRPPTNSDVVFSAAIAATDLRHIIWESIHDRRPKQLADALVGRIPALWLLLSESRIATSSGEALAGCAASGFFKIEILQKLRDRIENESPEKLPQTDDPIWKQALQSTSVWLDQIVAMAAARLERPSNMMATESTGVSSDSRRLSG